MQELSDRQKASQWAKSLLEANNWVILDTETTGLGPEAQICQIAVLTSTNPDGWQTYVKPTIPIEPGATNIHNITYEQVKDAPYFDQIFLTLLKIVGNKDLVIYNANFDCKLIKQSLRVHQIQLAFPTSDRRGCRIFTNGGSIHCAMHWYGQWIGEWNDYHGDYKWQKLPGGDHSALGDCKATLQVIQNMARETE